MRLSGKHTAGLKLKKGETEKIYFDDEIPGFGLRLRESGGRTWVFQYKLGAKHRRMTFGKYPALDATKAREQASYLHAKVRLGLDPAGEKADERNRASEVFSHVAKLFRDRQRDRVKPRSLVEIDRHLQVNCRPLHGLPFPKINRNAIAQLLTETTQARGPIAANRLRDTLSSLFTWAMREGLTESNPVLATNRNDEAARDRVLTAAELRSVWNALPAGDYGAIVKLLILTGQREREISDLRWSEIDLEHNVIRLPAARTKNKRAHSIPVSGGVRAILEAQHRQDGRDFVFGRGQGGFSGFSRCKERLDEKLNLPPWTLQDLRRSTATHMAEIGVQPHIIEAVLNHISGHKGGVAGIYNRASYEAEKATALARWADHVANILEDRQGNVAPLKRA